MDGHIPLLERDLHWSFKEGRCLRPGIAYEDVEDTKLGSDAVEQPQDAFGLGDGRREHDPVRAGAPDTSQGDVRRRLVSVIVNADPDTLRCQLQDDASA